MVFNVKKILKMGGGTTWFFDRCIATDGVACSIRYYKWVAKKDKIIPKNKKAKTSTTSSSVGNVSKTQHEGEKRHPQPHFQDKRIIGIDPGRKNIAFCVELQPGTRKTAKQYYCDSRRCKIG